MAKADKKIPMHTSAELAADFIATTSSIVRGRSSFWCN